MSGPLDAAHPMTTDAFYTVRLPFASYDRNPFALSLHFASSASATLEPKVRNCVQTGTENSFASAIVEAEFIKLRKYVPAHPGHAIHNIIRYVGIYRFDK